MNETAANATPRTSQSQGNGLNGGCSVPLEVRAATAKSPIEAEGEADPVSWRLVASFAIERSAGAGVGDVGSGLNAVNGDADADVGAAYFVSLCGAADAEVAPLLAASRAALGAGTAAGADPALCARGNEDIAAETTNRRMAAALASVEKVRSATIQTGAETRGTSDRDGTGIGRAAMSRAVPRSSARRVRQMAHVSRCACTEARASGESARSRYAERSPNGCTA